MGVVAPGGKKKIKNNAQAPNSEAAVSPSVVRDIYQLTEETG